jgi:hypothetical protein
VIGNPFDNVVARLYLGHAASRTNVIQNPFDNVVARSQAASRTKAMGKNGRYGRLPECIQSYKSGIP